MLAMVIEGVRRLLRLPSSALSCVLIGAVRFYQIAISPLLPPACRYVPSCSNYFIQAVRKYGPFRGAIKGTLRICRCHPFCQGGYDPP